MTLPDGALSAFQPVSTLPQGFVESVVVCETGMSTDGTAGGSSAAAAGLATLAGFGSGAGVGISSSGLLPAGAFPSPAGLGAGFDVS